MKYGNVGGEDQLKKHLTEPSLSTGGPSASSPSHFSCSYVSGNARAVSAYSLYPPLWPPSFSSCQWVCPTKASFYLGSFSFFQPCCNHFNLRIFYIEGTFVNYKHLVVFHVADCLLHIIVVVLVQLWDKFRIINDFENLRSVTKEGI